MVMSEPRLRRLQPARLQRVHQLPPRTVVEHGRAGCIETEPPAAALRAGVERPFGGRAAALAERAADQRQPQQAAGAEQRPCDGAKRAARRGQQVER